MSIYDAMRTAIGGLQAQSYALDQISGNIANSQTIGYKRTETSFAELVPDSSVASAAQQSAGGMTAWSRATNDVQGSLQTSTGGMSMAVSGDGYFVVEKSSGTVDNKPVFTGSSACTRRGDFTVDKNGYLVNGSGYYLKGLSVDPNTGNTSGSSPQIIRISNGLMVAKETTEVDYKANLPKYPKTSSADSSVAGSELLGTTYTQNPRATTATPAGTGQVIGSDATAFLDHSLAGGSVTAYDASGNSVDIQLRWAKVANASGSTSDTWELSYQTNSSATGTQVAWQNANVEYTFDSSGKMTAPASGSTTLSPLTVNGTSLSSVDIKFGQGGVTQYADANGSVKTTEVSQNGYAAGERTDTSITDSGRIRVTYSNGQSQDVAQVSLVTFNAEDELKKLDSGAYEQTEASGPALMSASGSVAVGSLESSNTDIADEFSKLMVMRQA
jgi:flagellar hook protein FlgE